MEGFRPYRLSPVDRVFDDLGAHRAETSGWRTALSFASPDQELSGLQAAVGLCDLSHETKAEICGRDLAQVAGSFGLDALPPPGSGARGDGSVAAVYRTAPDELFVLAALDSLSARLAEVADRDGCLHLVDRTSGFAAFLLAGPRAEDVLRLVTSLDLGEPRFRDLSCARGPLARIPALVARRDRSGLRCYEIFISREYGLYAWNAIREAGLPRGLVLFGQAARRRLEP